MQRRWGCGVSGFTVDVGAVMGLGADVVATGEGVAEWRRVVREVIGELSADGCGEFAAEVSGGAEQFEQDWVGVSAAMVGQCRRVDERIRESVEVYRAADDGSARGFPAGGGPSEASGAPVEGSTGGGTAGLWDRIRRAMEAG